MNKYEKCPSVYVKDLPEEMVVGVPHTLANHKKAVAYLTKRNERGEAEWKAVAIIGTVPNSMLDMPAFTYRREDIPECCSCTIELHEEAFLGYPSLTVL